MRAPLSALADKTFCPSPPLENRARQSLSLYETKIIRGTVPADCLEGCKDAHGDCLEGCKQALRDCLDSCWDRECRAECWAEYRACLEECREWA